METIFERIESDCYDLNEPISKHFLMAIAKQAFNEGKEAGKQDIKKNFNRVQNIVLSAIEEIESEEENW
jgi:hypothetical protein